MVELKKNMRNREIEAGGKGDHVPDSNESEKPFYLGVIAAIVLGLYLSSLYSYLLFHSLIEIITIAVAFTFFILTWNTRKYLTNNYLRLLGIGYAFIALIDLLHTLAYKGMNVFPGYGANLPTQLWIAARYLQAVTLFAAPLFVERRMDSRAVFGGYAAAVSILVMMVYSGNFPDCFIEGKGLTVFKIGSEYVISLVLLASLYLFYKKRKYFNERVFIITASSIACTVLSEIAFTTFVSVYGFANMVGHFAKLAAFYLIYRAILVTGLKEPFELIFRELTEAQKEIWASNEQLQEYVTALTANNAELDRAYRGLKTAQSRLLQQEKMASIGQLAAGVAHEINNPMGFIMSNLGSLQKYSNKLTEFISIQDAALKDLPPERREEIAKQRKALKVDFVSDDLRSMVKESLDGADRIKKIVENLKSFSRVDEAEQKMADINAGLDNTINIVWNELKYKATVTKDYGELPRIKCNPGQLNQVFMNILVNAAHSIEKQGTITIRTWAESGNIFVTIADSGCGIPQDKISSIFEPFFTTKEVGKGTGLGLSIAYDIVKKHKGTIEVESEVGKGTTFFVKIPVAEG